MAWCWDAAVPDPSDPGSEGSREHTPAARALPNTQVACRSREPRLLGARGGSTSERVRPLLNGCRTPRNATCLCSAGGRSQQWAVAPLQLHQRFGEGPRISSPSFFSADPLHVLPANRQENRANCARFRTYISSSERERPIGDPPNRRRTCTAGSHGTSNRGPAWSQAPSFPPEARRAV